MKADELREAYLSFFESRGHTRCPSASLVPENDATLLFTGAGMNQFKELFLGIGELPFRRATTAQKCFRTGDLENVGRTYYHQTFFEMLGNFSFGDYFKREAIVWQWEFLTKVVKLPADRLWISVYRDDDEAFAVWRNVVGIRPERIWRCGPKDNFWPANAPEKGPNGPCGPCSEVFFDFGSPGEEGDQEAGRYCEIGNLVFTQFNRTAKNVLEPLSQKNIDTGMGFERILAVAHGVRSNFETELFLPILRETARIAGEDYAYDHPMGRRFRRIADHVRAGVFLIADGVKPSNEGRGYVVRRVLRRAVRDGIALGIEETFLHRLAPHVIGIMGGAYPELATAAPAVEAFLEAEEEKFRETFETGMALLDREIAALSGNELPGRTAFVLYDTHGFPFDLCREICRERGLEVDREEFDRCMERQRTRSRKHSSMGGEVFVATALTPLKRSAAATRFCGYETEQAESEVLALLAGEKPAEELRAGEEGRVIVAVTPFYAEAGGQVGDRGLIEGPRGRFEVRDTRRVEGFVVHLGRVVSGRLARGERAHLQVDHLRRAAIRRNHSATHLLHAALRGVLGPHVAQAGSLVAPDRLRFDFTHPRALTGGELREIETRVNAEILLDVSVGTEEMDLERARATGAMALFGEKYAGRVRVVRIGEHSLELCGGTHVCRSSEIGACLLTHEGSVAAGVRRIEMVTGEGAVAFARKQRDLVGELARTLKTAAEVLPERIEALRREVKELRAGRVEERRRAGGEGLDRLVEGARKAGGVFVAAGVVEGDDPAALRALSDGLRARLGECVLLLAGRGKTGAALVATATAGAIAAGVRAGEVLRRLAAEIGGKGGGRDALAQGRAPDSSGLEAALERAQIALLEALTAR